jgi:hypothetical protein
MTMENPLYKHLTDFIKIDPQEFSVILLFKLGKLVSSGLKFFDK